MFLNTEMQPLDFFKDCNLRYKNHIVTVKYAKTLFFGVLLTIELSGSNRTVTSSTASPSVYTNSGATPIIALFSIALEYPLSRA